MIINLLKFEKRVNVQKFLNTRKTNSLILQILHNTTVTK